MTHRWIIRAHVHVQLVSSQINSSKGTSLAALRNTLDRAQQRWGNIGGGEGAADTPLAGCSTWNLSIYLSIYLSVYNYDGTYMYYMLHYTTIYYTVHYALHYTIYYTWYLKKLLDKDYY